VVLVVMAGLAVAVAAVALMVLAQGLAAAEPS
jgi:hypothetical protein